MICPREACLTDQPIAVLPPMVDVMDKYMPQAYSLKLLLLQIPKKDDFVDKAMLVRR